MTVLEMLPTKHDIQMSLFVTRREVRDAFRDWRLLVPIILLTVGFPALMNFTARRLLGFVEDYGATVIADQLIPFLLLVVGFFPISFSLIIALETFVGEKERKSMEPLLSTPLTNTQLYMGKMLASLIPPMMASYLGMAVYMTGLWFSIGWKPQPILFIQTVCITTVQGVIMVAGAVVVSSQTTSVRAANLLASFIIVPMALLIQFEAVAMFWGQHAGLWWLILALTMTAVILIRMGVQIFNREELLGREFDQIRLDWMWGVFWEKYSGKVDGRYPSVGQWYRQTFALLPHLKQPAIMILIAQAAFIALSVALGKVYVFPPHFQDQLRGDKLLENLQSLQIFKGVLPLLIFLQNVRVIVLLGLVGVFTFGVLALLVYLLPWGVVGYVATQFALAGQNPYTFLLGAIVPHALVEMPALLIVTAAALRWHTTTIAPPPNRTVSEAFLMAGADFARLAIGVSMPLLLIAAFIEAYITPLVFTRLYG